MQTIVSVAWLIWKMLKWFCEILRMLIRFLTFSGSKIVLTRKKVFAGSKGLFLIIFWSILKLTLDHLDWTDMTTFWLKLPFFILKMSEIDSASSITPRTTPKLSKSAK